MKKSVRKQSFYCEYWNRVVRWTSSIRIDCDVLAENPIKRMINGRSKRRRYIFSKNLISDKPGRVILVVIVRNTLSRNVYNPFAMLL